jgi:hypothetical protein
VEQRATRVIIETQKEIPSLLDPVLDRILQLVLCWGEMSRLRSVAGGSLRGGDLRAIAGTSEIVGGRRRVVNAVNIYVRETGKAMIFILYTPEIACVLSE